MIKKETKQFKRALILSSLLHIILVGLFSFGIPHAYEKFPEEKDVFIFEVVSVKDINNIKTQQKSKTEEKIAKKSKKVKTSKPTPKKKVAKTTTPSKNKEIIPKKKQKTAAKKTAPPKQENNPVDDILKNLELESEGDDIKTPTRSQSAKEKSDKSAKGDKYNEETPLSITEKNLIQNTVQKHWRKPAGSEFEDGLIVIIKLTFENTGKIKNTEVINTICPRSNIANMCKLVEESMNRALKQIGTIENLPPDRYNEWKEIILHVEPSAF